MPFFDPATHKRTPLARLPDSHRSVCLSSMVSYHPTTRSLVTMRDFPVLRIGQSLHPFLIRVHNLLVWPIEDVILRFTRNRILPQLSCTNSKSTGRFFLFPLASNGRLSCLLPESFFLTSWLFVASRFAATSAFLACSAISVLRLACRTSLSQ